MDAADPAYYYPYLTPHGPLTVRVAGDAVTHVAFGDVELPGTRRPSVLAGRAATELLEYFAGKRRVFDVPVRAEGTAFQRAVWDACARIPYGESRTAAQIARSIGRAGSHRAVGQALRANPLAVIVPDHRVVTASGASWGAGRGAALRGALLKAERARALAAPGAGGAEDRSANADAESDAGAAAPNAGKAGAR